MPKVIVHTLVKNESRWIWYALRSVIDYVDEIMVWDTGSTDQTVEIVKSIKSAKITLKELDQVDPESFTKYHQQMLEHTTGDWLLILDGDEIWPFSSIVQIVHQIKTTKNLDYIISPYYNLVGDVFHHQESEAGKYRIKEYRGHITIRAINLKSIPGLHFDRPHGQIGLFDGHGELVQDANYRTLLLEAPYLHATHMVRSSNLALDKQTLKRSHKYKFDVGITFPKDFSYPEVFYLPHPLNVASVWERRSLGYLLNSVWQTPLKMLKRRAVTTKSGY